MEMSSSAIPARDTSSTWQQPKCPSFFCLTNQIHSPTLNFRRQLNSQKISFQGKFYTIEWLLFHHNLLFRYVQSLMDAKLLNVNTDTLSPDSIISLNLKYTNKRTKFRIAGTVQKETPQEIEATHHAVEEDRKMYLQAAIVRIMKSRKLLKHNALIQEVLSQSKVQRILFFSSHFHIQSCFRLDLHLRFQSSKNVLRCWLTSSILREQQTPQMNIPMLPRNYVTSVGLGELGGAINIHYCNSEGHFIHK